MSSQKTNIVIAGAGLAIDTLTGLPISGTVSLIKQLAGLQDEAVRETAERLNRELAKQLLERVEALESELKAKGKQIDEMPDHIVAAVLKSLGHDSLGGFSKVRLDAILNAHARQFDPTIGSDAVRSYWLGRLRELSDLELVLLLEVARPSVMLTNDALFRVIPGREASVQSEPGLLHQYGKVILGDGHEQQHPAVLALRELAGKGLVQWLDESKTVKRIKITETGAVIARLASAPGADGDD